LFGLVVYDGIDATAEPSSGRRLGRLANHSETGTAYPRLVEVDGIPHLCLFASEQLDSGQQVLYNYGVKLPFHDLVSYIYIYIYICDLVLFNDIRLTNSKILLTVENGDSVT
jgi:hypothetical protein